MRLVTINTDASYSRKHSIGTYAFWIACDAGRFAHSGAFKTGMKHPNTAELRCIINSFVYLHRLQQNNFKSEIKAIIVNTDSLNSIHMLTGNEEAIKKYGLGSKANKYVLNAWEAYKQEHEINWKIEFRHVRSHIDTKTPRTYINEWCDMSAKKQMGELLAKLEKS